MREKHIIFAAKALSVVFTPFYLPLVGLAVLLTMTYLSLLPWAYKLFLIVTFWVFTIALPSLLIRLYRRYQGWPPFMVASKERRVIPYVISIVSYLLCYYIMASVHVPHFMGSILMAALVIQVVCAIVNLFIKVSTHMAAIGGVAGAWFLSSAGDALEPFIDAYLIIMGVVILRKAFLKSQKERHIGKGIYPLGLAGGFLDATGGGGWGPVVTSTMLAVGHDVKKTIGTVNTAEFLVTLAETTTIS